MAKISAKGERQTIKLYYAAIVLAMTAIMIGLITSSSQTMLYLNLGFGIIFIFFLITGTYTAKKRRITYDYDMTKGRLTTTTARSFGILGAVILLLPLIAITATSSSISTADLVTTLILIASGIVALLGALTYKVVGRAPYHP